MSDALTGLVASKVHINLYSVPVDARGSAVACIEISFASVYKELIRGTAPQLSRSLTGLSRLLARCLSRRSCDRNRHSSLPIRQGNSHESLEKLTESEQKVGSFYKASARRASFDRRIGGSHGIVQRRGRGREHSQGEGNDGK